MILLTRVDFPSLPALARLPEESFPTQFLEFIPAEGELFDPDERLTLDHFDRQTSLLFTLDGGLSVFYLLKAKSN